MSIKKQAVSGVKWTTLSTVVLTLTGVAKISILTRLLEKSDFGLMALVMFVLGFMTIFMNLGLNSAILHKQDITKNEYASLYWLNFYFSIFLFLIVLLLTPLVVNFYNEAELNYLLPLMGSSLIISAIGQQFKTIQQKNLKFKLISIINIIATFFSFLLAIYLAYNGYGVYSLVYSALVQFLLTNFSFLFIGVRDIGFKFHFSFKETMPFLRIGIYQVGSQIVNYFNREIDVLIIGKFFGTEILGGYNLAKQLVYRPSQVINPILTRVAIPVLAKFQSNVDLLKKNYLKLVNLISSINIPVYIIMIVFAPIIVRIMYGEGFENIILLVRILSFYMMFRAVGNPIGALVVATGRTDLEFVWNLIILIIMPLAIILGSQISIEWVAIAVTIAMILLFIPSWYILVQKMIPVSLKEYVNAIVKIRIRYYLNKKNIGL